MIYKQDISRAFSDIVGKHGTDKTYFTTALAQADKALGVLRKHLQSGDWPVLTVAERTDDLMLIESTAQRITDNFATLVVVGMGGSSRGGKALAALMENPFVEKATHTAVHFIDNIDPATSALLLASLDFKTTLFLVISKSGDTAETLAHMLILMNEVGSALSPSAVHDHFIVVTSPGTNALRRIAALHGITVLDHEPGIGGRFAALTVAGLLPAKVAGVDIRAVRRGAKSVMQHTFSESSPEPARGAALHLALMERGKSIAVMMPYCDRLSAFTGWYQQLWAESLGKKGKGTTPLAALGACDQHSQLQLYLNGPRDKFMTLILLAQADKGVTIPQPPDASLAYLQGHTLGDLMDGEQRATAETLTRAHVPLRLFTLPKLDAEALGALMMHFMLETMITAQLLSLNAFDQPAVEESKRLAREYLMQTKN
jgi:glucose-6-phosphate isomerase